MADDDEAPVYPAVVDRLDELKARDGTLAPS